jgi:hypothetical protein
MMKLFDCIHSLCNISRLLLNVCLWVCLFITRWLCVNLVLDEKNERIKLTIKGKLEEYITRAEQLKGKHLNLFNTVVHIQFIVIVIY